MQKNIFVILGQWEEGEFQKLNIKKKPIRGEWMDSTTVKVKIPP